MLGGGVIGVEFASVWRSFGYEVDIQSRPLPHLVPSEDEAFSKLFERALPEGGIEGLPMGPI